MWTLDKLLTKPTLPSMTPVEAALLKAWAADHGLHFDGFEVNARLGDGIDPGPTFDDATRKSAIALTKMRADLVAFAGARATILEAKSRATTAVVGQLISYSELLPVTFPVVSSIDLAVVCTRLSPDVALVLQRLQIAVFVYPTIADRFADEIDALERHT